MSKDKDLPALLASCLKDLAELLSTGTSAVVPSAVRNPRLEISKLSSLIKAHSTKVGIIFQPQYLAKDTVAPWETYRKLHDAVALLLLVVAQIGNLAEYSDMYKTRVKDSALLMIDAAHKLVIELSSLVEKTDHHDNRLILIGKLWSGCDTMKGLADGGELKELAKGITLTLSLIDDGFEEFAEWAENPHEADDDDFGFESDDSEDNADTASEGLRPSSPSSNLSELSVYAKTCVAKIGLVKLLFASLKQPNALPEETIARTIDQIFSSQSTVGLNIDKLIVELMMNCQISDQVTSIQDTIDLECKKIATIVADLHKGKEMKQKWYTKWIENYQKRLE